MKRRGAVSGMDLDAGLPLAGGFAVEDGIAARLHLVGVDGPLRVRGLPAGLVVHDDAGLHEIENTDQGRQPMLMQVGFHRDFHRIGPQLRRNLRLADVGFHEPPADLLLLVLLPLFPFDRFVGLIRPRRCILIVELLERERFLAPPRLVPSLEHRMGGAADVERRGLRLGDPGDVTEPELQPALQEERQPRGRHHLLQPGDDFRLGLWRGCFRGRRCGEGAHVRAV